MAVPLRSEIPSDSSSRPFAELERLVASGIGGLYSGATILCGRGSTVQYRECQGNLESGGKVAESRGRICGDEVFDLGSLTAQVVLSPLYLQLVRAGWVRPQDRVSRYLNGFSTFGKSKITLKDLVHHQSGLPAEIPFFPTLQEICSKRPGFHNSPATRELFLKLIKEEDLHCAPGEKEHFSNIGLIAAGLALESATSDRLDDLARDAVFQQAKMNSSTFLSKQMLHRYNVELDKELFAHHWHCPVRDRIICAEARDLNTWGLGGITGAGGLFSTAEDLHRFASWFLGIITGSCAQEWESLSSKEGRYQNGWQRFDQEFAGVFGDRKYEVLGNISETGCGLFLIPETGHHLVFLSTASAESVARKGLKRHILDIATLAVREVSEAV